MSFVRWGSVLRFVEGNSDCYIYQTELNGKLVIQDYGFLSDEVLVEFLCRCIEEYFDGSAYREKVMSEYLKKKLAERLSVKLRRKRLTERQVFGLWRKKLMRKK